MMKEVTCILMVLKVNYIYGIERKKPCSLFSRYLLSF